MKHSILILSSILFCFLGLINSQPRRPGSCRPRKWKSPVRDYGGFFNKQNFRPPGNNKYLQNRSPALAFKKCLSRPSTRVMHGDEAVELDIARMPWMAQIYRNLKERLLCSGTIIGNKRVLTTALCVEEFETLQDVRVIVGASLATGKKGNEADWRAVSVHQVYKHREHAAGDEFNIAILDTADIHFTTRIKPVKLWATLRHGETVVIAGFGKQDKRGRRLHLTCTNLIIEKLGECKKQLPSFYWPDRESHYICAGRRDTHVGACEGDAGGGVFKKINHDIRQYGIISTPLSCGEVTAPDIIVMFTPQMAQFFKQYGGPGGDLNVHG